jgi:hypothetical protein
LLREAEDGQICGVGQVREADRSAERGEGRCCCCSVAAGGRMKERPGDGNERVKGFCSVKEKGRLLFDLGRIL